MATTCFCRPTAAARGTPTEARSPRSPSCCGSTARRLSMRLGGQWPRLDRGHAGVGGGGAGGRARRGITPSISTWHRRTTCARQRGRVRTARALHRRAWRADRGPGDRQPQRLGRQWLSPAVGQAAAMSPHRARASGGAGVSMSRRMRPGQVWVAGATRTAVLRADARVMQVAVLTFDASTNWIRSWPPRSSTGCARMAGLRISRPRLRR